MAYTSVLSIIGRIHPAAWDAIIPHGPRINVLSGIDRVALNPQPLPPREAFLVGAAELAHNIVRQALDIEARGDSAFSFLSDTIDDWCGTPWPRKWPLPWPGPVPGPHPEPWDTLDVQTARIIGAIVFTSIATRLLDDKLSAVFNDAAERLTEAALGGEITRGAKPARTTGKRATASRRSR